MYIIDLTNLTVDVVKQQQKLIEALKSDLTNLINLVESIRKN